MASCADHQLCQGRRNLPESRSRRCRIVLLSHSRWLGAAKVTNRPYLLVVLAPSLNEIILDATATPASTSSVPRMSITAAIMFCIPHTLVPPDGFAIGQIPAGGTPFAGPSPGSPPPLEDRKSTRLNSSHVEISYAVFCLKKKKKTNKTRRHKKKKKIKHIK